VLFDLRSRGRRRTVQTVYLGLALLMFGGLVLFGVGAGNGFGGLLNAFTGQGSSNSKPVVSQAEKTAIQETRLRPNDPKAWADLILARWDSAKQAGDYDANTGTFTAAGRRELTLETQAWQRYLQLTKSPDETIATLAARAYGALGEYSGEASAWEVVTLSNPKISHGFQCLAVSAYAAGQTRKGDLASAKAISLLVKVQQLAAKQQLQQAKTNRKTAQQFAQQC
jgi:hypothetical protein